MICHHRDHVGNHLQSSAMSAADVADFLGISDGCGGNGVVHAPFRIETRSRIARRGRTT